MKISSSTSSPSSRSITQSKTGRPATLISGLGTRCVSGRSRVPLPASGMMTCTLRPPVAVLESDHVVQMRGGGLEHVGVLQRLELVHHARRHVLRLAGDHLAVHQLAPLVLV